jgi:hypothetical protein
LTGRLLFAMLDQLNRDACIRKVSALDAFQLFYEELVSSPGPGNSHVRRPRALAASKLATAK